MRAIWLMSLDDGSFPSCDQFPISADAQKFESRLTETKAQIGVTAAATVEALKPYDGGYDAYWRLQQLDILD